MRDALITICSALLLAACSDSPTQPAVVATPTPIPYPQMIGGWGGTLSASWTGTSSGSYTCSYSMLVTGQSAGAYNGSYQSTRGTEDVCASSGTVSGVVTPSGEISLAMRSNATSGTCSTQSASDFIGFVSSAGNITAQSFSRQQCGSQDYRVTWGLTLSKR